jgi:carboxyl-terminal processing protease
MRSRIEKIGLLGLGLIAGILVSLQFSAIAEKESGTPLPVEELRNFAEVFGRIKSDYVEPVSDKQLITSAINGMLSGLDPHSTYLDADAFKDLQANTQGEFGGLGIEVGMEDGLIKVISPIEDTPAFQAGLKTGDLIIKLDETLVKGMTLNDAVNRMRGKPGSKIVLTVLRKNEAKPLIFTLTRAVIKVKSVKSKLIEPGYAFLRITQFQERTGESLASAVDDMLKQGELKGIVLDLRNDPGGLLTSAVGVSAAFLPKNALVVYTEGRTEDAKMRLSATPDDYLCGGKATMCGRTDYLKALPAAVKRIPLVVLVNSGSASASEIVAGALQDNKRAVIMGTQTFGKGSVQTILPLGNGTAIKLTTARYYTPNGRSIQAKGIVPDIIVEDPATAGQDNALRLREADLDHHLINDRQSEEKTGANVPSKPAAQPKPLKQNQGGKPEIIEFGAPNDYQLNQAVALLKGMNIMQGR